MKRHVVIPVLHVVIVAIEVIALIHDIQVFGFGMFQYYTIDSNLLQLIVSACILLFALRRKETPVAIDVLHLTGAVCLTITFMIAAFVLAPQEGFSYYFLTDVAPINHFLGPLLSIVTFLFPASMHFFRKRYVLAPMAFTLVYGLTALILNVARVLDGPYFFLRVYEVQTGTIIFWFAVIAVMCLVISALYLWLRTIINGKHSLG